MSRTWIALAGAGVIAMTGLAASQPPASLTQESLHTLTELAGALRARQVADPSSPDAGAIRCEACGVLHTRAAEAVYPFAVMEKHAADPGYGAAAVDLGRWLIRQQQPDGSWKETPEEWTGTTTDQLLMMAQAFPLLRARMTAADRDAWLQSMRRAADYLTAVMDPSFASINYCATSAATLATMHRLAPNPAWAAKARTLAWQVAAAMDDDGFIGAEGERAFAHKYGSDLGYEMDMSLWGLALYAELAGDREIHDLVVASLRTHLAFVYPNGAIDGSWGIRSNKWTTFGSQTADGSQILFALLASDDPRGVTAGVRNLEWLRTMMRGGLVGYGPHFWSLFQTPCIYPTFARAKNLAMTVERGPLAVSPQPIPADAAPWVRLFPTVDVAVVRTGRMMATVSAYRYADITKRDRSKYMHRATGGALTSLWIEGYGYAQAASQTAYERWEPMHFPEAPGIISLTPRIELTSPAGYFTNLYEFGARLSVSDQLPRQVVVSASGELSDRRLAPGGVAYTLSHRFEPDALVKETAVRYRGSDAGVRIVEPIIRHDGVRFEPDGNRAVRIVAPGRELRFEVLEGEATLELGRDEDRYWAPFPALRACPIVVRVARPDGRLRQSVTTRLRIVK